MSRTSRVLFDSLADAAAGLLIVLDDARTTKHHYQFGSLSAEQVYASGLLLIGEVDEVLEKLDQLPGTSRYDG